MSGIKDWKLSTKLVAPFSLIVVLTSVVMFVVFYRSFGDIQDDTIPELQSIGSLRATTNALLGEYRHYFLTLQEPVLANISKRKDELARLQISYASTAQFEEEEAHFVAEIDAGLRRLAALGDQAATLRREVDDLLEDKLEAATEDLHGYMDEIFDHVVEGLRRAVGAGDLEEVTEDSLPEIIALGHAREVSRDYLSELREFVLEPSAETAEEIAETTAALRGHIADFAETAMHQPDEKHFAENLTVLVANLERVGTSVLELDRKFAAKQRELDTAAQAVSAILTAAEAASAREADEVFERDLAFVALVGVAAVIISLLFTRMITWGVTQPIHKLTEAAERFGRGDYSARVDLESRDEAGELARAFNEMAENLGTAIVMREKAEAELLGQERLAAIGQVTATVGHELRNPLGSIRSALAVIGKLTRDENPMMKESLEIGDRGITRCDAVISDLLDFTRLRQLNLEPTAIGRWLRTVVEEHGLPEPVRLQLELEAGIEMPLDRERLRRVVVNVIDNACHAMDANEPAGDRAPLLTLGTRVTAGRLEITVRDTGRGMAPEVAAKAFEPLYSTKAFGVGLGLPMVKQIMGQHGGGVDITSQEERGTEVVLWLPLAAEARGDAA